MAPATRPQPALEGRLVRLEPLAPEHVAPLMGIALATPDEFRLTSTPLTSEERDPYFEGAFRAREEGRAFPYAVRLLATAEVVGCTRLAALEPRHRHCELGYTWFRPDQHGTGVNVESKLLLLDFAFERLGLVRVHLYTDTRNERSQRAIRALGATFEGVLRRHMIVRDGYVRDSMVFSITDLDWPEVKVRLTERLERRLKGAAS